MMPVKCGNSFHTPTLNQTSALVSAYTDGNVHLNSAVDIAQIGGNFVHGMGWMTSEELMGDDDGYLMTHGPSAYKMPGRRDNPPAFNLHLQEDAPNMVPDIFQSQAIGEPPLMHANSLWPAIRDALLRQADNKLTPKLNVPATLEAVQMIVVAIQRRHAEGASA